MGQMPLERWKQCQKDSKDAFHAAGVTDKDTDIQPNAGSDLKSMERDYLHNF